jgi:hypothetical protein
LTIKLIIFIIKKIFKELEKSRSGNLKKVYIALIIFFLLNLIGCSNSNEESQPVTKENNETVKHLALSKETGFEIPENKSYDILGEMGKYGLLGKNFKIDKKTKFTWLLHKDKNNVDELIGKEVKLYWTSESPDVEQLLATSKIEKLTDSDPQIPDEFFNLKFNVTFKLPAKGKWKVDSYLDDKLLGTTVFYVEGRNGP